MPAGNFDPDQYLNSGRVEWPRGPLTVDPGFSPKWLQTWIVQGGPKTPSQTFYPGPVQSTNQSAYWSGFAPGSWTATEPGWLSGSFNQGTAVGIAVLALENAAGSLEYEFWVDTITLF